MSDKIKIIKSFTYGRPDNHPELDLGKTINKSYDDDMKELVTLARTLNADRHEMIIKFSGNTKRGLNATVECSDTAMGQRINNFFAAWFNANDK